MKYVVDFDTFQVNEGARALIKRGLSFVKHTALSKISKNSHTIHVHTKKAAKQKIKLLRKLINRTKDPQLKKRRQIRLKRMERELKHMI